MGPLTTEGWNGQSTHHAVSRSVRDNAALLDLTRGMEIGSRYDAPHEGRTYLSALNSDPGPLKIALWDTAPNGTKPDADAQAGVLIDLMEIVNEIDNLGRVPLSVVND